MPGRIFRRAMANKLMVAAAVMVSAAALAGGRGVRVNQRLDLQVSTPPPPYVSNVPGQPHIPYDPPYQGGGRVPYYPQAYPYYISPNWQLYNAGGYGVTQPTPPAPPPLPEPAPAPPPQIIYIEQPAPPAPPPPAPAPVVVVAAPPPAPEPPPAPPAPPAPVVDTGPGPDVYRWQDAEGVVHYSTRASEAAKNNATKVGSSDTTTSNRTR